MLLRSSIFSGLFSSDRSQEDVGYPVRDYTFIQILFKDKHASLSAFDITYTSWAHQNKIILGDEHQLLMPLLMELSLIHLISELERMHI